ncbi:MAG: hypothetical protein HQL11_02710 [Candidatus Omnitrophica bacterium]|nr:hypothetical protein [Candidatus Omnitrophota bacterium]
MWNRWFPWKWMVRQVARKNGFLDPMHLLSQVQRFSQPSEVLAPTELLRLSASLHARGFMNAQVIQHNLDWIWPYWVNRQFDPRDPSFVPRAFSLTHINLTHRNWTAIGLPDSAAYPIVDPRGLVTPHYDGWSVDAWIRTPARIWVPSQSEAVCQIMESGPSLRVKTSHREDEFSYVQTAWVEPGTEGPQCRIRISASAVAGSRLAVVIRPCNPEGVSFVHDIRSTQDPCGWVVNQKDGLGLDPAPEGIAMSDYKRGDVNIDLMRERSEEGDSVSCPVGMATAAFGYAIAEGGERSVLVTIPLKSEMRVRSLPAKSAIPKEATATSREVWAEELSRVTSKIDIGDSGTEYLFEASLKSVILHSPGEVYPGPFTYKRFWFRDAVFMLYALLLYGSRERVQKAIERFPRQQHASGYFSSQEGEWDSNGQVLWLLRKWHDLAGWVPDEEWRRVVSKAVRWIISKRTDPKGSAPHAGLLPAGFSAEHLGPNDYYYWDDFWAVRGLEDGGFLLDLLGETEAARRSRAAGADLRQCLDRSLALSTRRLGTEAMPSSPYRRLDSASVGSIIPGYPLDLWERDDPRLKETLDYLCRNCMVNDGFFHQMSHSGINIYLTLHIAQNLMRQGDERYGPLVNDVMRLASPTGQWPEAVHPTTGGGCMGDGQHAWASAEWIIWMRDAFVYESRGALVVSAGLLPQWLKPGSESRLGPLPTSFGDVHIHLRTDSGGKSVLRIKGRWKGEPPRILKAAHSRVELIVEGGK